MTNNAKIVTFSLRQTEWVSINVYRWHLFFHVDQIDHKNNNVFYTKLENKLCLIIKKVYKYLHSGRIIALQKINKRLLHLLDILDFLVGTLYILKRKLMFYYIHVINKLFSWMKNMYCFWKMTMVQAISMISEIII